MDEYYPEIIGAKLKQYKEENNLSERALARLLDTRPTTVHAWIRGKWEPRSSNLLRIAQLLGVSMDEVIMSNKERKENNIMKFKITRDLDYVSGNLRCGHLEGIVEAASEAEALEKVKTDPFAWLSIVIDDYEVEDYDAGDNPFCITKIDGGGSRG